MNINSQTEVVSPPKTRHLAPAFSLVVLAPLIAEVLSGSTRISFIFAFVPELMLWGCGALIIREVVRRWNGGWTSMLLLGLGLSIAEEFLIQQTSLAPLPWPAVSASYGRLWGVNWIYFLFMLGYESVWVVLVPVQVTELIFAKRRNERWLGNAGLSVCGLIFLLGALMAWYAWIKRARPMVFHAPVYNPPVVTIAAGVLAIALLALVAHIVRRSGQTPLIASRWTPPAWIALLSALIFGFPWYGLMTLIFGSKSALPFWIPVILGIAWAAMAYLLILHWSSAQGWQDMHRWALTFGAVLVCMIGGFSGSGSWPRQDLVGKWILDMLAVAGFFFLVRRIQQRKPSAA
jgi:hypothetical protein